VDGITACVDAAYRPYIERIGRNWARIVFLVLFVIGALPYFAVLAEMFARPKLTASLSVIQLLLQAAAMVLVFTRPGSAWFRRQA
jgi:hypothetical protein